MQDTMHEQETAVETPAVPSFDEAAEADAAIEAAEKPSMSSPTRRKKGRGGRSESPEAASRRLEAYEDGERSKDMQYDEWIEKWDWDQPRMYCTVKRTSPQLHRGVQVGGRLDGKANGYFTEEEVQQRFGGGTFVVYVSGRDSRTDKFRALGSKQLVIGAEPRVDALPQQQSTGQQPQQQRGGTGVEDLAPQAQAGLVGLLGEQMKHSREAGSATSNDPEVLSQMQRAYEQQAHAVATAADARVSDMQSRNIELARELSQLRIERDTYQHKAETEVSQARSEGDRFVSQMLPTFAQQADARVQQILHDTGEKVRSIQEQYARDLQNHQAYFQQQLQNQSALFQTAEKNSQMLLQGQIQHLQTINATLQAKIDSLEGECRGLRDQVTNMHMEAARKQDPMQKLQEMQTLQEVIQGMSGKGGDDDDLGDVSPMMKLAAKFAPAIAGALDVAKMKMGGGMEQQHHQQYQQQPMQQQPMQQQGLPPGAVPRSAATLPPNAMVRAQQAPQAPQQARPPQRRARIPRSDSKVSRQDLVAGVALLNAAISSGASPAAAADTAASQFDRNTLNALCARKPEVVIRSLQGAGILNGAVASDPGLQYLTAFLQALQTRINPAPPQLTKQPPVEPAEVPTKPPLDARMDESMEAGAPEPDEA